MFFMAYCLAGQGFQCLNVYVNNSQVMHKQIYDYACDSVYVFVKKGDLISARFGGTYTLRGDYPMFWWWIYPF